jgi:NADH:ubiquinone oxidoreductase subunit K
MGHKWLAATRASGLGEGGLAGSEVAARCTRIASGSETAPASVAKAGLAAIGVTITAGRKTTIATTVVTTSEAATTAAAFTTGRCAAVVTAGKAAAKTTTEATAVIAATYGTTEAATGLGVTVVVGTARGATATTEIATARCLRRPLRGLHAPESLRP